jgi:uncharacterized membrane protein (UPF0127 family)
MRAIRILLEDGRELAGQGWRTENSFERAQGWLGRDGVQAGEALLIAPCASIHSLGMRFAFDVAFLDRQGQVLSMRQSLRPGRLAWGPWRGLLMPWTVQALELPAGRLQEAGVAPGQRLRIEERGA